MQRSIIFKTALCLFCLTLLLGCVVDQKNNKDEENPDASLTVRGGSETTTDSGTVLGHDIHVDKNTDTGIETDTQNVSTISEATDDNDSADSDSNNDTMDAVDSQPNKTDSCDTVICNSPPASYCVNSAELVVFDSVGYCSSEGICKYPEKRIACSGACKDGQCAVTTDAIAPDSISSSTVSNVDTETDTPVINATDSTGTEDTQVSSDTQIATDSEAAVDATDSDDICLGRPECPGTSCAALLQEGAVQSGVYWIDPEGSPPFEIYCDQETDGGGWGLVWKNHGGAIGGEQSNENLLAQTGLDYITSHDEELVSAKHQLAYSVYSGKPGVEWLKMSTLWQVAETADAPPTVLAQHAIRINLPSSVTWNDFFVEPTSECYDLGEQVVVHADGDLIGYTSFAYHHAANGRSFGLANTHETVDMCGQEETNLVDPLTNQLFRLNGTAENTIRHLMSYVHNEAGADASRCQYACWNESTMNQYFDGFTWAVRDVQ